jgi:hypothetical protein
MIRILLAAALLSSFFLAIAWRSARQKHPVLRPAGLSEGDKRHLPRLFGERR